MIINTLGATSTLPGFGIHVRALLMNIRNAYGIGASRSFSRDTFPIHRRRVFPWLGRRIDFTKPETDRYYWYGWNEGPPEERWTEAKAAMVFSLGHTGRRYLP